VILYLNAQSVVRKVDELSGVASINKPDKILVTESWCHDEISDAYLGILGYELQPDLRTDREDTNQGRGGGLLVYTKSGVKVLKIDKNNDIQQYCSFIVNDVTVFLVYRSPNAPPTALEHLSELMRQAPKNSVFIGDFNLPDIDWGNGTCSARTRGFLETVEDMMMEQMVDFATQTKGNCLDLLITNIPERVSSIEEAGRLGKSDHEMLLVKLEVDGRRESVKKSVPNWRLADWQGIKQKISDVNWRTTFSNKTTCQMWDTFSSTVNDAVKCCVPMKRGEGGGRPYWMTREILAEIGKKKRLWKKAKEGGDREPYKQAEKKVKNMIRNAKRNFEKKLARENGGNSKPFYAYVKNKTKSRPAIGPLKNEKKETVADDQGMAELLNSFFSSVFTKENTTNIPAAEEMDTALLQDVKITERTVREKIRQLKTASAAGPDGLGPRRLQELEGEMAPALTLIFQRSIQEARYQMTGSQLM